MKTGSHSVGAASSKAGAPKQKHTARNVVIIVIAVILLGIISLGVNAYLALRDARTIQGQVDTFKTQVLGGDKEGSEATAQTMADAASDMHAQMSNPLWTVLTVVPVYGSDIRTVQTLSGVADELMNEGLVPLVQEMPALDTSKFFKKDGSIAVKRVVPLVKALGDIDPAVQEANEAVSGIEGSNIEQVNSAVQTLKENLPTLAGGTRVASKLSPVLADMLGANGKRTYLLVAQNNVEMRSTGGFPGSMGPLVFKNGKMKLGKFKSVYDWIPRLDRNNLGEVKITKKERSIFSYRMASIPGDAGQILDFTRVGNIWNQEWNKSNTRKIDGIIAIDPVFLQALLGLTGGFTASNGWTVDGTNAAEVLMNRSYKEMPIEETDDFYASVAGQAFKKVLGNIGKVDFVSLVKTAADQASQSRLNMWMKDSEELSALQAAGLTGSFSSESKQSALGVYVSDFAWSKYAWYLSKQTTVGTGTRNADGTTSYDVTVTFTNTMTTEELSQVGTYIYGDNTNAKRDKGDMVYFLYLVAPSGGSISNVKTKGYFGSYSTVNGSDPLDGKKNDKTMAKTSYEGRELWGGETQIEPGKTTKLSFTVTVPAGAEGQLEVTGTPSADPSLEWSTTYN